MHTHLVGKGSSPGASSAEKSWPPDNCRERLIAAALELCAHKGYNATTIDQVAAKASVSLADFAGYFATVSTYVAVLGVPNGYESESDVHLRRRMITNLSESFGDVMGEEPQRSE